MPVNTAALKTFAPAMRRQLLEAVGRKLDLLLNCQTPDTLSTYASQIAELREQEAENREQLLERVAYTWFNRLCALRYLDARGWHPFGCKVLMPAAEGETQPEILKLMRAGSLPGELKAHTNDERLNGLLDGQIPTMAPGCDPQSEVYQELVLASCRSYHQLFPNLFEGLDDASDLLLPDDLLSEGSIAGSFRREISDSDCNDIEIIGWLYQFYISEKKDEVIGSVIKSKDIPAATQLFTPNWIVKYMVQNSLGSQWLATYPYSSLKGLMEYYIEPAEESDEVIEQLAAITPKTLNPEQLTLIDPACGSGHILVEAYELFKAIYLELGYRQIDVPQLILTRNIFGLDIDERAAQLTGFALIMKGRADDRRLFERELRLNVMALLDSSGFDVEGLVKRVELVDYGLRPLDLAELKQLFEHATTYGSLIQVPQWLAAKLPSLKQLSEATSQDLFVTKELKRLGLLVQQAELLAAQYDAVVANPPYMGGKGMNPLLKTFAKAHYAKAKSDLFACFIERGYTFAKSLGHSAMVTLDSWMFLSSYTDLRRSLLEKCSIKSMVHVGWNCFPQGHTYNRGVAFTLDVGRLKRTGRFINLSDVSATVDKESLFLERMKTWTGSYSKRPVSFKRIPECAIAYWISDRLLQIYNEARPLAVYGAPRQGLATADNDRFLRMWFEVSKEKIEFGINNRTEAVHSRLRWFPYNKGGEFRKWYGNQAYVINWEGDGAEIYAFRPRSVIRSPETYFKPSLSWSKVTSAGFSLRYFPPGFIYDVAGCSIFFEEPDDYMLFIGLINSTVMNGAVKPLSPTINFEVGQMSSFPVLEDAILDRVGGGVFARELVALSIGDWDAYERSWKFRFLPVLQFASKSTPTIESTYSAWIIQNRDTIAMVKRLEEENNRLFIDAYGLTGELAPDVPLEQITLTVNPAYRYAGDLNEYEQLDRFRRDTMAELLSYATGCMMGRYSLDHPGLILADSRASQAEQLAAYEAKVGKPLGEVRFNPDPDGIIPVLDGEWFEDDIVSRTREFLTVTFPESSVAENLRFIEESLGKDIRKYFCSEFYKDHLQNYKKRPIYWMVQSPKKGFSCLIYLHRYTKDTLNQVLNNYFRPYLQKLEARLAQLGLDQLNDDLPARERTAARKEAEKITKVLKECQAWEQDALLPLAQQRIPLDLDDGVKVNYLKLQDVLAPIPGLAAKED